MARLPLIPRHKGSGELRIAYDRVARAWGMSQTPPLAMQIVQCFSVRPEYVEPVGLGHFYAGWAARTPRDVLELVAVLVSKSNECFYSITTHSSALQAAGMQSRRVEQFAEGDELPANADDGERAIARLVEKTAVAPALLGPQDLHDVTSYYGPTAAVDITGYLYLFHFINRIADLVGISSDLPLIQRRWPWLRRMGVRAQGAVMRRIMNFDHCVVDINVDEAVSRFESILGPLPPGFASLELAPNVAGLLDTISDVATKLDRGLLKQVGESVRAALPSSKDQATGIHERPTDPFEALIFVGTRYAARTTDELVRRVRAIRGLDDREVLDLFYAISMHNGLERMRRLLAVPIAVGRVSPRAAATH